MEQTPFETTGFISLVCRTKFKTHWRRHLKSNQYIVYYASSANLTFQTCRVVTQWPPREARRKCIWFYKATRNKTTIASDFVFIRKFCIGLPIKFGSITGCSFPIPIRYAPVLVVVSSNKAYFKPSNPKI